MIRVYNGIEVKFFIAFCGHCVGFHPISSCSLIVTCSSSSNMLVISECVVCNKNAESVILF